MTVPTFISRFLNFLQDKSDFDLLNTAVSIRNMVPSFSSPCVPCDRFVLEIPYASGKIDMFLIFQASDENCPPDIVFPDLNFDVSYETVKSLNQWNPNAVNSLYLVICEIMEKFKLYNIEKLTEFHTFCKEYKMLVLNKKRCSGDIEVLVDHVNVRARFLIRLHLNFERLPRDVFPQYKQPQVLADIILTSEDSPLVSFLCNDEASTILAAFGFSFPLPIGKYSIDSFLTKVETEIDSAMDYFLNVTQQQLYAANFPVITRRTSQPQSSRYDSSSTSARREFENLFTAFH